MKHKLWMNNLIGAVFAFLLSVSVVGNLVTGYDLQVVSMMGLFLWCAGCSLISAFLFGFKYGGTVLLCLTVLAVPIICKDRMLWDQWQSLCYAISSDCRSAYGWPTLGKPITDEVDRPLMVLSAWSAVSVSWSYCRRKNVFIALPSVILPAAICMITTNNVPDEIYLYLLILGVTMLLVTDWTRRKNPAQTIRLTLRLVIPMAAALALLFAMNPQKEYVNNTSSYQEEVVSWFQQLWSPTQSVSGGSSESAESEKFDLRNVGPRSNLLYGVMSVNASIDGTIYLRGRDYDIYSGTGWESSLQRTESFTSGGTSSETLFIKTYGIQNVLYVPYYATKRIILTNGALNNDKNLRSYGYYLSDSAPSSSDTLDSGYTELPSDTQQWASKLNVIIDTNTYTQDEKIRHIKSYVENSAIYDLSTSRMSSDYNDFAQWFLEESGTGYCVHFATAATVLLRAAGIPARYVEGYMVTCKADQEVIVLSTQAHAWTEYYDSGSGTWRILEATPADLHGEEEPEATVSTTPEETKPAPSETEPSHSEETTTPPQTTPETQPIDQNGIAGSTGNKQLFTLPNWIKTVFWIMFAAALVLLQGYIRIGWKRRQWNQGRSNEMLIARWRQTKKMARIINHPLPEELELLAQKASFSQHRIQPDELQLFEDYREDLLKTVRNKPWHRRILLRWIFAIGR